MKPIQSFEEGCKDLEISTLLPGVSEIPERFREAVISHYQLMVITEAVNADEPVAFSNTNKRKYWPWFDIEADESKSSGFGLSLDDAVSRYSVTNVGSRLTSSSDEAATYIGEHFNELYEKL